MEEIETGHSRPSLGTLRRSRYSYFKCLGNRQRAIDTYSTSLEHEARIQAHMIRVQRDLEQLDLLGTSD